MLFNITTFKELLISLAALKNSLSVLIKLSTVIVLWWFVMVSLYPMISDVNVTR